MLRRAPPPHQKISGAMINAASMSPSTTTSGRKRPSTLVKAQARPGPSCRAFLGSFLEPDERHRARPVRARVQHGRQQQRRRRRRRRRRWRRRQLFFHSACVRGSVPVLQ